MSAKSRERDKECDLTFMSRQQVIAFLDIDESCDMDVRYKSISLPAGLKKILISNPSPEALYPSDPHGAIARRLHTLHITSPTYHFHRPAPWPAMTNSGGPVGTPPTQPAHM